MGRPRAEQQASRKDPGCEELVDETALGRTWTDLMQPELPLAFRCHRNELHFVGNRV